MKHTIFNIDPNEEIYHEPEEEALDEEYLASLGEGYEDENPLNGLNLDECERAEEEKPPFEIIQAAKMEEGEKPLSRIVGHENQKKELLSIIDWFRRSKELKAKGISIPKGVLLFGEAGNGKSLLIKEIIRCCECPVFVFKGDCEYVVQGICNTFNMAREKGHAIIVFDELDLLIDEDSRVIRALQENLDGVESNDDILVLAATNNIRAIPFPLRRCGRLEKLISIPDPRGEEAVELLKKNFKEFNVAIPEDFDDDEVALALNNISFSGVKSIVNDIVLRNGFENITVDMVYQSIYNITDRVKDAPKKESLEVAIHEAGHCVMASAFPQYFIINRLNISGASGGFYAKEKDKGFWPFEKVIADIKISMAGILSQKIICGRGTLGSVEDLEKARHFAYHLFNKAGYNSCWETLPPREGRADTQIKRRKMERKIESLLKRCEKETSRYIKRHKTQISTLGNLLYEKKRLKSSEILSCIE